jgi:hypothetical protein
MDGSWNKFVLFFLFQEKSSGRSAHYKLTSTSMLWLQTNRVGSGTMNLGGSLTRQVEQVKPKSTDMNTIFFLLT